MLSCVQRYTHTYEQFLKVNVGLGLVFVNLFRFVFSGLNGLDYFVPVLFASVVLGLVSSEIGWEERLRNDPFCVEWDVRH